MLTGKKILVGITGSIAAYKSALLVRLLVKAGAEVRVIMTAAARDFIAPLTMSTLSKNPVATDLFKEGEWENHVMLGRWADLMVIAPLSCNTLSKMACGACDNLLTAVYLSATCPVMLAPAMDEDMWNHPSTRNNLDRVRSFGNIVIPVDSGELASGLNGEGRMAEPGAIIQQVDNFFLTGAQLAGKKALITAGPTFEAIDPVRFIGNHSSGKMGIALAKELQARGASVTLVLGPSAEPLPGNMEIIHVTSAAQMHDACIKSFPSAHISILSAAVADYRPVDVAKEKIKKSADVFNIQLTRTTDILKELGSLKKPGQLLVGFALETNNEKEYALGKLEAKNADMIVLNSLNDTGAGFRSGSNKITIFDKAGNEFDFELKNKAAVAKDIVNIIVQKIYA